MNGLLTVCHEARKGGYIGSHLPNPVRTFTLLGHLMILRVVILMLPLAAILSGCATSSPIQRFSESKSAFSPGPVLMSHDFPTNSIYRIYHRASTGFVPIQDIRQEAEQRASDYCQRQGKGRVLLGEKISQPPYIFGNFPRIEIIFACADRSVLTRPTPHETSPDNTRLKATGTGFFVTEDGYILTNFHVVENANSVKVKHGGQLYDAEVVRKDLGADLAVIKIKGKFKPLVLADSRSVKLGQKVFTLGFPKINLQGEEPKFTEGSVSGLYGMQDDAARFQISVPVQPGNSGGPLVNSAGEVVGIIVAKLRGGENVNYAVKSSRARLMFDDLPVMKLISTEAGPQLTSEQVAERLTTSAALLLIY